MRGNAAWATNSRQAGGLADARLLVMFQVEQPGVVNRLVLEFLA